MKIVIEYYRIFVILTLITMLLNLLSFYDYIDLAPDTLMIILFCEVSFSAIVALTNIKDRQIKAYWKKEKKNLFIPFREDQFIIAYDDKKQIYTLGVLLFPKKVDGYKWDMKSSTIKKIKKTV